MVNGAVRTAEQNVKEKMPKNSEKRIPRQKKLTYEPLNTNTSAANDWKDWNADRVNNIGMSVCLCVFCVHTHTHTRLYRYW